MRKRMEDITEQLANKKREANTLNVSLKSKLENISNLTKEIYIKSTYNEERYNQKFLNLEQDFLEKQQERLELEALNRLQDLELKNEITNSIELEYSIQSTEKMDILLKEEFEKKINFMEYLTKERIKQFELVNAKIKELESKTIEEPYYKIENEKNNVSKKKIDFLEREILEHNTKIETNEISNDYIIQKKENVIKERKKLMSINDEIKREIEAKQQIHEIRVQKRIRDKNCEEIQKLDTHLQGVKKNVDELGARIEKEVEKSKNLQNEVIKASLELRTAEDKGNNLSETVDIKFKELNEIKVKLGKLREIHAEIREKVRKYFYTFLNIL